METLLVIIVGIGMVWLIAVINTKDLPGWPPNLTGKIIELTGRIPEQVLMGDDKLAALAILPDKERIILVSLSNGKIKDAQYSWSEVISVELVNDGTTVTSVNRGSQLIGAMVGGAIAGGVGALIGGLSANAKTAQVAKRVELVLTVDDLSDPRHRIALFDLDSPEGEDALLLRWNDGKALWNRTAVKQKAVNRATEIGLRWLAALEVVITRAKAVNAIAVPSGSNAVVAELEKLVELKTAGMLTDEEFVASKKRVLDP